MLNLTEADGSRMKAIEAHVARSIVQFKNNTEAMLVVFALVRCARLLLKQYPEGPRKKFALLLCDFLQEKEGPDDTAGLLVN